MREIEKSRQVVRLTGARPVSIDWDDWTVVLSDAVYSYGSTTLRCWVLRRGDEWIGWVDGGPVEAGRRAKWSNSNRTDDERLWEMLCSLGQDLGMTNIARVFMSQLPPEEI